MEDFHRLRIYREARILTRELFAQTRRFPTRYRRLAEQLDEAVDSIGSNIAEGCSRKNSGHGNSELIRYGHMSFGSACEVEHRLATAYDRHLIAKKDFYALHTRVVSLKKQLSAWLRYLEDNDRGRRS
jgi:four helix bundle protein